MMCLALEYISQHKIFYRAYRIGKGASPMQFIFATWWISGQSFVSCAYDVEKAAACRDTQAFVEWTCGGSFLDAWHIRSFERRCCDLFKTTWYVPDDCVLSSFEDCHAMLILINGYLSKALRLTVKFRVNDGFIDMPNYIALMKVLSIYAQSFIKNFSEQPVSDSVQCEATMWLDSDGNRVIHCVYRHFALSCLQAMESHPLVLCIAGSWSVCF